VHHRPLARARQAAAPGHDRGDPFVALASAAALGALDAAERRTFDAHARLCPLCRAERRAYEIVAAWLPLALAPRRPSAGVRARVLARIAS
jgi:hypothetical protein